MKTKITIFITLLSFVTIAKAEDEIGGVFFGIDILPNNEYNETRSGVYRLQKPGAAFGLLIPINLPFLDCHYRVKISIHKIKTRAWDWQGQIQQPLGPLFDKHISVLNELLIGKEFRRQRPIGFLPQLGLGVLFDGLYQDDDSPVGGVVYHCLFVDFASTLRYHFKKLGMGIMVNYQLSVRPSWDGYEATDRIAVSCIVFM